MTVSTALQAAAISTFEELCFLLPAGDVTEVQAAAEPDVDVEVAFSGPRHGRLLLRLCGPLLPELAANMLGAGDVPASSLQQDAAGEIANVICGNVLPQVMGDARVFLLSAPKVQRAHAASPAAAADSVVLGLGEGRIELRLEFQVPL